LPGSAIIKAPFVNLITYQSARDLVTQFRRSQLANPTDRSSLPIAELNPLLNPLLAKNMGRWAEVYFNAVPEKREEAVQGLLRQLVAEEAGARSEAIHEPAGSRNAREIFAEPAREGSSLSTERHAERSAAVTCPACGHENAIGQRFCGMCGAGLAVQQSADYSSAQRQEALQQETLRQELAFREPDSHNEYARSEYGRREYSEGREELNEYYRASEDEEKEQHLRRMFELTPSYSDSHSPYRIVIASAVAIVAVVLVIVAWRSGQVASAVMRLRGETPPATTQQQTPPLQSSAPQDSLAAQNANTENSGAANAAAPQSQSAAQSPQEKQAQEKRPEETDTPKKALARDTAQPESAVAKLQPVSAVDNGGEELATAQRYLQTNRAEAAQWLWKSVAKRNLEATLLLSDLYLRGEGVGKNCDQARILLDAAATRGSKEAGVRLSHMQAFGCQ
jgi:hypothetical protein